MKQGDVVMIYDDPITKKKREGNATLIEKLTEDTSQEYWQVRFIDDGYVTGRWIEKGVN